MPAGRCFGYVLAMALVACRPPDRPAAGHGGNGGDGQANTGNGNGGARGGAGGASSNDSSESGGSTSSGGTGSGGAGGDMSGGGGGSSGVGGSTAATGGTTASAGAGGSAAGSGGRAGSGGGACGSTSLPSSFSWSIGKSLMDPVSDSTTHNLVALKDPSLVFYNGHYQLYATVVNTAGASNMTFSSFVDFASAGVATAYYMDYTSGFSGTRYSPQVFYLNGQKKWYLITQSSGPAYSTASDPSQANSWTKPTAFFSSTPGVVTQNAGSGIGWSDFWVICDSANCHLFFSNQNNVVFRSQTSLGSFPNGFGTPVIVMQASGSDSLYAVSGVYKVGGGSKYLLLVEANGSKGHFIRAWTADKLDGTWSALADTEANPFAGASNVTFSGGTWTKDISQGEIVRSSYDETATINPCTMQFLFQGRDPYSSASATLLPWKLGLLTKGN